MLTDRLYRYMVLRLGERTLVGRKYRQGEDQAIRVVVAVSVDMEKESEHVIVCYGCLSVISE